MLFDGVLTMNVNLRERYEASMVLSGVGDAIGYRNGMWEFCKSGAEIQTELHDLGGLAQLVVDMVRWRVSDDTVMHLATADAIVQFEREKVETKTEDREHLYKLLAIKYKECMRDMDGRAPGYTCMSSTDRLRPEQPNGYQIPFNARHGGCGGAMRAMCIGLRYPREEDLDELIAVSIESGRMTHHHPVGYLGSLASALFTHYAIQGKPVREWGAGLMTVLPRAMSYVVSQGRDVDSNRQAWDAFTGPWRKYLKIRGIEDGQSEPHFPEDFTNVTVRETFYNDEFSYSGWHGSSGHDAPLVAYDALLAAGNSWDELCMRGVLHGGDNDSTGAIACAWFGALYGFTGVPQCNYQEVEYRERMKSVAEQLFSFSQKRAKEPSVTAL